MTLALFDLDNTLLAGDSDFAWGQFIVTKGMVDKETYSAANLRFYEEYQRGELDAYAYQRFCMAPLAGKTIAEMAELHAEFMRDCIVPIMLDSAQALIEQHRAAGDRLVVITATNQFIVKPIIDQFDVDDLICSETGIKDEVYTGELIGEPCMGEGKVRKLNHWMVQEGENIKNSTFYSDSHNDLPLLKKVDNPISVDPDDTLRNIAIERNWPIISLR